MNVNGCDSLITLNLTVNTPNTSVTQAGANLTSNATSATYQWLVCPGFTPIVGETNQSFTASANGDYAVAVTENGCTDTSACYTVIGIGIQEINNASSFLLKYIDRNENIQCIIYSSIDIALFLLTINLITFFAIFIKSKLFKQIY